MYITKLNVYNIMWVSKYHLIPLSLSYFKRRRLRKLVYITVVILTGITVCFFMTRYQSSYRNHRVYGANLLLCINKNKRKSANPNIHQKQGASLQNRTNMLFESNFKKYSHSQSIKSRILKNTQASEHSKPQINRNLIVNNKSNRNGLFNYLKTNAHLPVLQEDHKLGQKSIDGEVSIIGLNRMVYKSLHVFSSSFPINDDDHRTISPFRDCLQKQCTLSHSADIEDTTFINSDAILFDINNFDYVPKLLKLPEQIWILHLTESPLNTPNLKSLYNQINWTASYRADSTIYAPYDEYREHINLSNVKLSYIKNISKSKSNLVAWYVTNCGSKNARLKYVQELQKYIPVDIYGLCGPLKCDHSKEEYCLEKLRKHYMFYLSFENSNCKEYITEKFWKALRYDTVPVVMGANKEDYIRVAPPKSFIHTSDFNSAKELADYLIYLSRNPHKYHQYFQWKKYGFISSSSLWCKLCNQLHSNHGSQWLTDVQHWWSADNICDKPDLSDFKIDVVFSQLKNKAP